MPGRVDEQTAGIAAEAALEGSNLLQPTGSAGGYVNEVTESEPVAEEYQDVFSREDQASEETPDNVLAGVSPERGIPDKPVLADENVEERATPEASVSAGGRTTVAPISGYSAQSSAAEDVTEDVDEDIDEDDLEEIDEPEARLDLLSQSIELPHTPEGAVSSSPLDSIPMEETDALIRRYGAKFQQNNELDTTESEEEQQPRARRRGRFYVEEQRKQEEELRRQAEEEELLKTQADLDSGSNVVQDQDGIGVTDIPDMDYIEAPDSVYSSAAKATKEAEKHAVAAKGWDGNAFTEKAVDSKYIKPDEIGVGVEVIEEVVREPKNNLIDIVNAVSGSNFTREQIVLDRDEFNLFCETINRNRIYVIVSKSPVINPSDANKRRLVINFKARRGVFTHPTQTKIYNMDFDGDGAAVSFMTFSDGFDRRYKSAMSYLRGTNGKPNIDDAFFPKLTGTFIIDEEAFIGGFNAGLAPLRDKGIVQRAPRRAYRYRVGDTTELAKRMYAISYPSLALKKSDVTNDDMDQLWLAYLDELERLALSSRCIDPANMASELLFYSFNIMRQIANYNIDWVVNSEEGLANANGVKFFNPKNPLRESIETIDEGPENERTINVEGFVRDYVSKAIAGVLPINHQTFLSNLHKYIGDIEGKNIDFRVSAGYAKSVNYSKHVFKGNDSGAFELYEMSLQGMMAAVMNSQVGIEKKISIMQSRARWNVMKKVRDKLDEKRGGSDMSMGGALYLPRVERNRHGQYYVNYGQWLKAFIDAYTDEYNIMNMAWQSQGFDMKTIYDKKRKNKYISKRAFVENTLSDKQLISGILSVYGDFTIKQFFSGEFQYEVQIGSSGASNSSNKLLAHYGDMTLREFAYNNSIVAKKTQSKEGKKYWNQKNLKDDIIFGQDLLFALANKKTAAAAAYGKAFDGDAGGAKDNDNYIADIVRGLKEIEKLHVKRSGSFWLNKVNRKNSEELTEEFSFPNSTAAFEHYIKTFLSYLDIAGTEMFQYFGMSNPKAFLNGKWGKRLRAAAQKPNANDAVAGVFLAMQTEYRLRRVRGLQYKINELLNGDELRAYTTQGLMYVSPLAAQVNELQNRLNSELSALASSSPLWNVLVQELRGDVRAFKSLVENQDRLVRKYRTKAKKGEKRKLVSKSYSSEPGFWKDENRGYSKLLDVMLDPNMSGDVKKGIAADVLKSHTSYLQVKNYEIPYQLMMDPDPSYTSRILGGYREKPHFSDDMIEAHNKLKRFFDKSYDNVKKEVEKCYKMSEPGQLENHIRHLAENPQAYLHIPDDIYITALVGQTEKDSNVGEKSSQQDTINILYSSLMNQLGGLIDGMYRVDARTLGVLYEYMLTPYDLIYILAHPEKTFTCDNGKFRFPLSRASLCGDNYEESLWDFLMEHPKIATMLRCGTVTVSEGNTVYSNARLGFEDSFNASQSEDADIDSFYGQATFTMMDDPAFGAFVSMFCPVKDHPATYIIPHAKRIYKDLQGRVIEEALAYHLVSEGKSLDKKHLLDEIGVNVETLMSQGGMEKDAAQRFVNSIRSGINRWVFAISDQISSLNLTESDVKKIVSKLRNSDKTISYTVTPESMLLARANMQTLNGAKTSISTGIEGSITQKYAACGLYAMSRKDRYFTADGDDILEILKADYRKVSDEYFKEHDGLIDVSPEEWVNRWNGRRTNAGVLQVSWDGASVDTIKTNVEQLEENLPGTTPLVIEGPEDYNHPDPTLDFGGSKMSTVGRFTTLKRMFGTEDYNLKVKKTGEDDTHSITKFKRYDEKAKDNLDMVYQAFRDAKKNGDIEGGLFNARLKLAEIIQQVDNEEGYKDFDLGDYFNLANEMILVVTNADNENDVSISIRGLGQISMAIQRNMPQEIIDEGSPKEIIEAAEMIANEVYGRDVQLGYNDKTNATYEASLDLDSARYVRNIAVRAAEEYGIEVDTVEQMFLALELAGVSANYIDEYIVALALNPDLYKKFASDLAVSAFYNVYTSPQVSKYVNTTVKRSITSSFERRLDLFTKIARGQVWKGKTMPGLKNMSSYISNDIKSKSRDLSYKYNINLNNNTEFYLVNASDARGNARSNPTGENVKYPPVDKAVWFIKKGTHPDLVKRTMAFCNAYGINIAFDADGEALGEYYDTVADYVQPAPFGDEGQYMMVSYFNARLAGAIVGEPMAPAGNFDADPDRLSQIVEDPDNIYGTGDAGMITDRREAAKTNCDKSGVARIPIRNLFYNVRNSMAEIPGTAAMIQDLPYDVGGEPRLASREEVIEDIINNKHRHLIDLGISPKNDNFNDVWEHYKLQLAEFEERVDELGPNGRSYISENIKPDRIVGFMRIKLQGVDTPIYAPIIPFQTATTLAVPVSFNITSCDIDSLNQGNLAFGWEFSGSLMGHVVKVFDATNPTGKSITLLTDDVDLGDTLDGIPVGHITAEESFASRRLGYEARMGTLRTLALTMMNRRFGYNWADHPSAFPDESDNDTEGPHIKRALQAGYVDISVWPQIAKQYNERNENGDYKYRYSSDRQLDAFIRKMVNAMVKTRTTNPTDFLACRWIRDGKVVSRRLRPIDFDFFFEPSMEFQDSLMAFFNAMEPKICPPSMDDWDPSEGYLFKPVTESDDPLKIGCLQKLVPFNINGTWKYKWCNVYTAEHFYNDDLTAIHKVGLNGSHDSLERINAIGLSGMDLSGKGMRSFARNATSLSPRGHSKYDNLHVDWDEFIMKVGN